LSERAPTPQEEAAKKEPGNELPLIPQLTSEIEKLLHIWVYIRVLQSEAKHG